MSLTKKKEDIKVKSSESLSKDNSFIIKSTVSAKKTLFPVKLEMVNAMLHKSKLRSS